MGSAREELERFRALVLELGLPRPSLTFVGLRCPYCGKSDRVHKLENPAELDDPPEAYVLLWERYGTGREIVVCTFCRQLLGWRRGEEVRPLAEPE